MDTTIIDGNTLAGEICRDLAVTIEQLRRPPLLSVIVVGNDPASKIYVGRKERMANKIGIQTNILRLPDETTTDELLSYICGLNNAYSTDAILVQLPLPAHIDMRAIFEAVDPDKDVDGFHPLNAGRLSTGDDRYAPCTPKAVMTLLQAAGARLNGASALVVGRSAIVGRPTATMLINAGATVTVANSQTRNLPELCRQSDIVISATGRPHLIRGNYIKPDALVIDVGINRLDGRLVGDVAFDECLGIAGAITPVPGGVGPMTIASLLQKTVAMASR